MGDTNPIEPPEAEATTIVRPSRTVRMGRRIRRVAVDTTPLRSSRDYRLLWSGELVSETGHQMSHVAVFVQVFQLTRSASAVGLVGLVELVPLVLMSIAAGGIVDAVDRRKLWLGMQFGFAAASTLLLVNSLSPHPPLGVVYLGAGLTAGLSGIASPTQAAMTPRLVSRKDLPSAIALNQVMWNSTAILGPAAGGVIIGAFGLPWAYGIDAITYGATITAGILMRPMPPAASERRASGVAAIREGFAYLKGRRVLQSTFIADLIAMVFGMPRALFPILAVEQFHDGAEIVGVLFSALAVGALGGALTTGWVGRVRHQGRAVIIAIALWGGCIVGFGLAGDNLALAVVLLAAAGAADVISAVFRSAILQLSVPDQLRGRISAIHILVVTGGPRLGDFEAGMVAAAFSPVASVISGGLACLAGVGILALAVPQFRRYQAGTPT